MTKTDIARRVYNHAWKLDPIVRSLLDTDFYKLLMLQMIWGLYPKVEATFSLINRTTSVRLAEEIDEQELRDQLDHARTLRFSKKEMIWLGGNTFYGRKQIFEPEFLAWLAEFPAARLRADEARRPVRARTSAARGCTRRMWEIPALAIINELRSRSAHEGRSGRSRSTCSMPAPRPRCGPRSSGCARCRICRISDFGTRRRHSFLWQRWCVEALKEGIGDAFTGTSNVLLAMDTDLEALGTNAHELPMVLAALADSEEELRAAPYKVLQDWQRYYGGNLLIVLPDAFGTAAFLRDAPDWVADWTGFRPDSAPPIEGGEKIIAWWREKGVDPREKLLIFSDGLDVDTIEETYRHFRGKVRMAFGWGTNLTNDFEDCAPMDERRPQRHFAGLQGHRGQWPPGGEALRQSRRRRPAIDREIERYLRVFGETDRVSQLVKV